MPYDFLRALAAQAEGKAIPAHPALMDFGTPVSVYSPGASRQDAKLSQREAMRHSQAYGGDQAIDAVYDSIGLYQSATATAPWSLVKDDGTRLVRKRSKGTPPDHELGPQDLYRLLDQPNPFMLYDELIELLIIDLLLVGNAYWFKWRTSEDGKPLAIYRLAPAHVKIIPGPFGPKRYEYQPPGAKDALEIGLDEVIHFKRPNPHSAYYGLGVIQGAGRSMDLDIAITETLASYYENRADPSMIVQSDRRVPRDVFNKLRAQLRARTAGSKNAGELLVLEAGLKASSLSATASDALFDKLSKMSQDRVYSKFRTSRKLLGLQDDTAADKLSDIRREFDNATLRPFMDKLQRAITHGLVQPWGVDFQIDYRYQMPPDEAVKVFAEIAAVPGMKVREIRGLYTQFGIEESTGDTEIDEMVLNLPMDNMDANGQGGAADRPLGSEPGRPPLGKNTSAFPRHTQARSPKATGKALEARAEALYSAARAEGKALTLEPEGNTVVGKRLTGEQRPQDRNAADRAEEIDSQMAYISQELRSAVHDLERELLDHSEGKALYTGKTSNVLKRIKNSPAWTTFRKRVQAILEEAARRSASAAAMHSGLTPDEEIDYDAIASSVANRPDGVRGIIKTLKDRVASSVKDSRAQDEDIDAAISGVIDNWVKNQIDAIADSEAVESYNEGTLAVAEAAGVASVFVTDGDEDDEPCKEADGQVWDIAQARANRKEHPRCRRAFIPLAEPVVS